MYQINFSIWTIFETICLCPGAPGNPGLDGTVHLPGNQGPPGASGDTGFKGIPGLTLTSQIKVHKSCTAAMYLRSNNCMIHSHRPKGNKRRTRSPWRHWSRWCTWFTWLQRSQRRPRQLWIWSAGTNRTKGTDDLRSFSFCDRCSRAEISKILMYVKNKYWWFRSHSLFFFWSPGWTRIDQYWCDEGSERRTWCYWTWRYTRVPWSQRKPRTCWTRWSLLLVIKLSQFMIDSTFCTLFV